MSSVQLLDKTRKIGKLLHNNNSSKVVFNDICKVLCEILSSNVLVISKKGKVLGVGDAPGVDSITELIVDQVGGFIDALLNERLLAILSTKENVNLETLGFEEEDMTNQMALMVRVFQKAMQTGDVRAAEFLRDTAGYNPETNLKERQFKYEKDKANGMNQEIEDTSDVDDLIYGGKEEKDDTV